MTAEEKEAYRNRINSIAKPKALQDILDRLQLQLDFYSSTRGDSEEVRENQKDLAWRVEVVENRLEEVTT